MDNGLVVVLPILFLIAVVAALLLSVIGTLIQYFPVLALIVAVFAMVLLTALCIVALKRE